MNLLEIMGCCIPKDEQKKIKFTEVQEFHLKKKKKEASLFLVRFPWKQRTI